VGAKELQLVIWVTGARDVHLTLFTPQNHKRDWRCSFTHS